MEAKKQSLFFRFLDMFEDTSVTILYGIMVVVIFLQVFFRFVVRSSLPWSEELARYVMAYAIFIGAAIAAKESAHIGILAVVNKFPKSAEKYTKTFAMVVSFIFSVILIYLAFLIVQFLINTGQKSPALRIPIWIAYLSVPLGAVLMSIRFMQAAFIQYNERRE